MKLKSLLITALWCICGGLWLLVAASNPDSSRVLSISAQSVQNNTLDSESSVGKQVPIVQSDSQTNRPVNTEKSSVIKTERQKCININVADSKELEKLPGVGAAIAARIVQYRAEQGVFTTIDDLEKVKGIGPAKLAKMRDKICL